MNRPRIVLVVNPGSTSTKLAVFTDCEQRYAETIWHPVSDLERFPSIWSQFSYRLTICRTWASKHVEECDAVVAIGGLLKPVPGGTYRVNERMVHDAESNLHGEHASNLGCAVAYRLAHEYKCLPLVVDPVSVDEFEPLAYYSGYPTIKRRSLSHAVSIHAAARRTAREMSMPLDKTSFVVCHLGGGISIAAVRGGRIIDVNDAASDGPFSPERTGGLPLQAFIDLCYSHTFTKEQVKSLVMGRGGLVAYLGTNSTQEVERMIDKGDEKAREVYQAMAYQIAKEIGAMGTVLKGNVDAIIITGGIARSSMLIPWVEERVRTIARVIIYPGDDEMKALAAGALRVLQGEEPAKEY